VHTNGALLNSLDRAYKFLREMHEYGVTQISLDSYDSFHEEQAERRGISTLERDWDFDGALKKLSQELSVKKPFKKIEKRGCNKPLPFGRAKKLPKNQLRSRSTCYALSDYFKSGRKINPSIDYDGQVYFCCFMTMALGSATETPVDELLEKFEEGPVGSVLLKEGFAGLAKKFNPDASPSKKRRFVENPCVTCEELTEKIRNEAGSPI